MFELLFFTVLIYLFLSRSKKRKKLRGLDAELRELVESSNDATGIGLDIKHFLLSVINDDNNDVEKFSHDVCPLNKLRLSFAAARRCAPQACAR